jgi:DNA replication protein DnaC
LSLEKTTFGISRIFKRLSFRKTSLPNCNDTGYVDGKKCGCFKSEIINILYQQSNIKALLAEENFSTFSYDHYSDNGKNSVTGISPLQNIKKVVSVCKNFIEDFDQTHANLFFYGETGVGKTFYQTALLKK